MDPFAALADPVRRALLEQVATEPSRVVDLAAGLPVSRPAVSRHLRVLGEAGLVTATDRGRERLYRLDPTGLAPVVALVELLAPVRGPVTSQALDALDTEVRRTTRDRRRDAAGRSTPPQEETA